MISTPLLTTTLLLLLLLVSPSSLLAVSSSSPPIINKYVTILETSSPSELRQRLPRGFSHALLSAPTLVINKKKSSGSNNNVKNYNEVLLFAVSQRGIAYLFSMNKEAESSTRQYELKSQLQLSAPCRSDPIIVVENDQTSSSVILSLQDGSLVKLTTSESELKIVWQQKSGAKSWGFTPVLIENTNYLFAGYRDDHVTAYDISQENQGKILGKVEKSDGVWNAPSYFIDDDPKRRIARLYIARTASTQIMCADISSLVFSSSSSSSSFSFPVLWRYDIVQKVTNYRQQIPHWIWTTPMRYCRVSTSSCDIWFGSVDGVLRAVKDETGTTNAEEVTITVPSFTSKIPCVGGISQNVLQVSSSSSTQSSILSIANSGSMLVVAMSEKKEEFRETKITTNAAATPKDEVLFNAKASDDLVLVVTKGCVITLLKITETNSVSLVETSGEFEKRKNAKETCTSARLINHQFFYGDDPPMLLTLGTSQGRIGIFELAILPKRMKSTGSGLRNTRDDDVGNNDQSTTTTATTTTTTDLLVAARTAEEKDSTMIMIVALVVLMAAVVMLMKSSSSSKR